MNTQETAIIDIIFVGDLEKYKEELSHITQIKENDYSHIFTINSIKNIDFTYNIMGYSKPALMEALNKQQINNTTLCFIDCRLEGNYFRKKLSDKVSIITFHQVRDFCIEKNVSIKGYILRHLYKSAIRIFLDSDTENKSIKLRHDYTRGCLYDFCGEDKFHIVFGFERICSTCEAKLNQANLPSGFVGLLKKELKSIAKKFNAPVLDDEIIIEKLNTLNEHKMAEKIFVPLLKKIGLHGVKFTGGSDEHGIDIEYFEISQPEGDRQYVGVQFKKGSISYKSGGGSGSIKEITNQADEAFEKTIKDYNTGGQFFIHRFVVATTGTISKSAITKINEHRSTGNISHRHITYWDKEYLAKLIRNHWHDEFIDYFHIEN